MMGMEGGAGENRSGVSGRDWGWEKGGGCSWLKNSCQLQSETEPHRRHLEVGGGGDREGENAQGWDISCQWKGETE